MCLLPAYQTLALAAKRHKQLFTADHRCKISRMTMMKCLLNAKAMAADNGAVRRMSQQAQFEILDAFGVENYGYQTAAT